MNFYILFMYFVIYSILGWLCEVIYCRILDGKFTNRGFLNGPYCPIYGFGALLVVLFLDNFISTPILVFLLGMLFTSTLEYITSFLMEKIFNAKWWDYSNMKFNINGRVCLLNSLEFATLSMILTYLIHPQISKFVLNIPTNYLAIIVQTLFFIMIFDLIITSYTILNLKEKLKQLRTIADEIIEVKKKDIQNVDVINHLENIKNEILLKTTIMHNRIITAFPDINFKRQNIQFEELKEKALNKLKRKSAKKLDN